MTRLALVLAASALALAGCQSSDQRLGSDGKPLPRAYFIGAGEKSKIQFRMLDSVNELRQAAGAQPLKLDSRLNAAAATHSRDMSVQNRPWHFGSDGSSPLDRVARVGYQGILLGENISETFETEMQTLAAWMDQADTRNVILDPNAVNMGFSWHQEPNGKLWWTLLTGSAPSDASTS
ncbi:MAG: hypothetical protein CSA73_00625 [Rhodobacterales bacterium]|nr:MAG: hypothetical protein CSA73_00625 [Rhodobacterales bacterium]